MKQVRSQTERNQLIAFTVKKKRTFKINPKIVTI